MKLTTTNLVLCGLILVLFKTQECLSANILAVTTMFTGSHYLWNKALLMEMVRRGHNVTIISHEYDTKTEANFTNIIMEDAYQFLDNDKYCALENFVNYGPLSAILSLWYLEEKTCEHDVTTKGLKRLMDYPKDFKFDLIIYDINRGRCLYPLIDRFGTPPVIGTTPFGYTPHMTYLFGSFAPSHVIFYELAATEGITFWTRLQSYVYNYVHLLTRQYHANPKYMKIAQGFFGKNIRHIDDFERNISLLLANIDPVFNYLQPLPPNVIPVGGLHIPPVKKLPEDLQNILDNAKGGVIVVGFGSKLNWLLFGQKQKQAIIDAFKQIKETILFKSPENDLDLPSNVILRDWIPQRDVLAHPNVKLLITHGGALSIQEAITNGVPVVGIPIDLDQHGNVGRLHARKLGRCIPYKELTAEAICGAVTEVLNNSIYYTTAQKAAEIYKSQPLSAMERAVYWTEYILKHGNVHHLSLPSRDFNFFQNHELDLIAVLLIVLGFLTYVVYKVVVTLNKLFTSIIVIKQKRQ